MDQTKDGQEGWTDHEESDGESKEKRSDTKVGGDPAESTSAKRDVKHSWTNQSGVDFEALKTGAEVLLSTLDKILEEKKKELDRLQQSLKMYGG